MVIRIEGLVVKDSSCGFGSALGPGKEAGVGEWVCRNEKDRPSGVAGVSSNEESDDEEMFETVSRLAL